MGDKSLAQMTFGPGPDRSPMPDPSGKGIYVVNGKSTGYLTAYNTKTKASLDIAAENATQPGISHDGKRLMYVTIPSRDRNELWVADVEGGNKTKLAQGSSLATATWAPDDASLAFFAEEEGKPTKFYTVKPDGSAPSCRTREMASSNVTAASSQRGSPSWETRKMSNTGTMLSPHLTSKVL